MASYTPELEQYVDAKVQSGEFVSREEFLAEAVRLYREIEERHRALKADIDVALQEPLEEAEELDIDAIKRELDEELDEQGKPY